MSAPYGRTYRIQIDVIAEEHVTVLPTGNLILEDAVDGNYTLVERHRLDEYAQSQPPYTAHIADYIRRELISALMTPAGGSGHSNPSAAGGTAQAIARRAGSGSHAWPRRFTTQIE